MYQNVYLKHSTVMQDDPGIKTILNLAHEGRLGKCKVTKGAFCVGTDWCKADKVLPLGVNYQLG